MLSMNKGLDMIERGFIYISISISGQNFDVYGYAKSVGEEAGAVVTLRHVGPPPEDDSPTHWRGKKNTLIANRSSRGSGSTFERDEGFKSFQMGARLAY
jgi:hypothetical protein